MKMLRRMASGALLAGILVAACDDGGPTAGPRSEFRSPTTTINGVRLVHTPSSLRLQPATTATAVIGPYGGTIEIDGARLTVPPGALNQDVEFAARGPLEGLFKYRFGPNGLHFNLPATLTIQVDGSQVGVDPNRLAIAIASDEGDDWQVVGGAYDSATQTVAAQIDHFTQYALCLN